MFTEPRYRSNLGVHQRRDMTDYHSAIQKSEILPFATTWRGLEGTVLNEVSQTENDKYHRI